MNWITFAFISMVFIVFRNTFEKVVLKKSHSIQFLTLIYLFNVLLVLPLYSRINFHLTLFEYILILIIGISAIISLFLYTRAIKHLELSCSRPLGSINPLIILLLAFLFLGETIEPLQFLGVFLVVFSSFLLLKEETLIMRCSLLRVLKSRYIIYVFIATFIGSISSILDKILLKTVDPLTFLFISRFVMATGFLIIIFLMFGGSSEIKKALKNSGWLIFLLAITNLGIAYFYNLSLADIQSKTGLVAAIRDSSLIFTILVGGEFFKERRIKQKLLIIIILIFGLFLIVK